ncbi:MAG TPA: beta-ketoacyl-[acyl-carrier-protein] synthase family protein [Methylomirabilota bacterium]
MITGLGVVAPNGLGKDAFWANIVAGKSAIRRISLFDASSYPCQTAAEVSGFQPEAFMLPARAKHRGRFSQFAVAAAKLALKDALFDVKDLKKVRGERLRIGMGTSMGGAGDVIEDARIGFARNGFKGIPIVSGLEFAAHAAVSHVSVELGIHGQALTLGSACTTGFDAVDWATSQIVDGHADVALAGATDAPLAEFAYAALSALGIFASDGICRPYDLNRSGMVLGEGAAVLVLEEIGHAMTRGAPIYAEVLSAGHGNEGGFGPRTDSAEKALASAIRAALSRACLTPTDIDYISAHGNGLPDYDLVETRAFKDALGETAYNIPISSIKSMIGHAMGAGSVLQVAASCLSIQHGLIPPTINLETPDPECDLDYVPQKARVARVRRVLLNAHAMGGTHSVLVLGAPAN